MNAIGGIMDVKSFGVDFDTLNDMRLALSLRGRNRSSAFVCGSCGMFFNGSENGNGESTDGAQPMICERRGHSFALCIDGEGQSSSAVMEAYLVGGVETVGRICGRFAMALYDGERNMLLLARDKGGRTPLYYSFDGKRVLFASEIKGINAAMDCVNIDRCSLIRHLISPAGTFSATRLYADVREVLPGECVLFTSIGMSRFFYRERRDGRIKPHNMRQSRNSDRMIAELPLPTSKDMLTECLCDALLAFDRPQFDMQMPGICQLLRHTAENGRSNLMYYDGTRMRYPSYAAERDDRLGALYGIRTSGVLSKEMVEPSMWLYRELCERVSGMSSHRRAVLGAMLGTKMSDCLLRLSNGGTKKEDTEENIRILGMLCQTVDWAESARLTVLGESNSLLCDAI